MFGGSNASDYKIVMAKHHAGSSAVLSSGPAVQLRPHNFVVTCIASQKKFALIILCSDWKKINVKIVQHKTVKLH